MAKPIVDMFSWNAPENSLQALYDWYLGGGDEDAGGGTVGTGGITNVYTGGGNGGGANLQYDEMPVLSAKDYGLDPNAMQLGYQPVDNQYYLDDIGEGTIARDDLTLAESIVGDRGLRTIRKSDDEENLDPEWLKKIKSSPLYKTVKPYAPTLAAQMMGGSMFAAPLAIQTAMRPDATESAVGIGGLYAGEANLLEDLLQAGLLVDAGNQGIKTITGKNVISLKGGYEEGQQEIYDKFLDKYGSEDEVEEYFRKNPKTTNFFQKQWKEAKFNRDRKDIMTANTIANMKNLVSTNIHDIAKDAPDAPDTITPRHTAEQAAASEDAYQTTAEQAAASEDAYQTIHSADPPSGDFGRGVDFGPDPGGSYHWAKGGRVGYGKGGIVDLL